MSELFTFRPSAAKRPRGRYDLELVCDSFAGGGGASMGIERALGRAVDLAINHDPAAIAMHELNHPATRHLHSDIREVDPVKATRGRPVGLAWFSPDCTHFSRAKGSVPVSKKIRGLAWIVVKWARTIRPRVMILENVREFQTWGPLADDGKPCKARAGRTFKRWTRAIERAGYAVEFRVLNAADYGAPTKRRRLFMIARRDGEPIRWPDPTHGPDRLPYRTAAECIDWSIPCPSIFTRKKPLAEKTLRRIALGIKRYVIDAAKPFIVPVTHVGDDRVHSIDEPLRTVTTAQRGEFSLVAPHLMKFRGDSNGHAMTEPMPTITSGKGAERPAGAAHAMGVCSAHISTYYGGDRPDQEFRGAGIDEPLRTQPTENRHSLVAAFLAKHYGGFYQQTGAPLDGPTATITASDHHGLASASLIRMNHGDKQWASVDEPMRTVLAGANHSALVYAFLSKYFGTAIGANLNDPSPTSTTKHRLGLVEVNVNGEPHFIADIGMRMLEPRELARAQGFPDDYLLPGPKYQQVAAIGNSVCPPIAEAIVKANFKPRFVKAGRHATVQV